MKFRNVISRLEMSASKTKTIKPKYSKKDPVSHVLDRPEMYVGSIDLREADQYVVIDDGMHITKKKVTYSPAIVRMFIEPMSNIIDNCARSRRNNNNTTKICIDIDEKAGTLSFWNNGDVIPVEIHPDEKCYNHSLIFGQLLSGSNYDDDEDRHDISGKQGLGHKLCNIFSSTFTVEGTDPINKKKFSQTWTGNMKEAGKPIIKPYKLKKGYTKVTFTLDFPRFGLKGFTEDIISIYKKYVVDCAMYTKIPVFLNDEEIPVGNLVDYAKLFSLTDTTELLHVKTSDCEVVLTPSDGDEFEHISFCNGVNTFLGGNHVNIWSEAIFRPLVQKLNKPKKPQITIGDVKKFFRLFVIATVSNPRFDSQSKGSLEFPSTFDTEVKTSHITAISKWSVMAKLQDVIRMKELSGLKKTTERKKRGYERVPGLEPANKEGGKTGHLCNLILVEGLSAKTYAVSGIKNGIFGQIGRDWNGILPLRGKILNTRNANPKTIEKNTVVVPIIKAVGLQHGLDYTKEENYKTLRYGRVVILTDSDDDGRHITGLIQNLFHSLFPSVLLRENAFLVSMQTPIVKIYKKEGNLAFYCEEDYREYIRNFEGNKKKLQKKYCKGLGSSNTSDIQEDWGVKMIKFVHDEKCTEMMNKAFHSKQTDIRKKWIEHYDPSETVLKWNGSDPEELEISYSDYLDKEFVRFSVRDCARSLPNMLDGLKESHRKILYVCFLRNLKYKGKTLKVAQLGPSVAEKTDYHHGEQNLYPTIAGMAQSYVGSNNIPYLFRDGQFGTRYENGRDSADPRYIFTKLDALTRLIYRQDDDMLLDYIECDGQKIEPRFYVPIIPMILVNGCVGIGTGWSCNIPCYNPIELIDAIKIWLDNHGVYTENDIEDNPETDIKSLLPDLKPWYRGHTGEMHRESDSKFISWGTVERNGKKAHITELPVGMATVEMIEILEKLREEKKIVKYINQTDDPTKIDFTVTESDDMECNETNLKLFKYFHTTNMVLFTEKCQLKKYKTVQEIIDNFCTVRLEYYVKRKKYLLAELENKIKFLGNKKRFLEEVRDGKIKLFEEVKGKKVSIKTSVLVGKLEKEGYDKEGVDEEEKDDEAEDTDVENNEDNETEDDEEKGRKKSGNRHGYEYLLKLQIQSITEEKIKKLRNEIASNIEKRDELEATTEGDIWRKELDELVSAYEKYVIDLENEQCAKPKKKGKAKKAK